MMSPSLDFFESSSIQSGNEKKMSFLDFLCDISARGEHAKWGYRVYCTKFNIDSLHKKSKLLGNSHHISVLSFGEKCSCEAVISAAWFSHF